VADAGVVSPLFFRCAGALLATLLDSGAISFFVVVFFACEISEAAFAVPVACFGAFDKDLGDLAFFTGTTVPSVELNFGSGGGSLIVAAFFAVTCGVAAALVTFCGWMELLRAVVFFANAGGLSAVAVFESMFGFLIGAACFGWEPFLGTLALTIFGSVPGFLTSAELLDSTGAFNDDFEVFVSFSVCTSCAVAAAFCFGSDVSVMVGSLSIETTILEGFEGDSTRSIVVFFGDGLMVVAGLVAAGDAEVVGLHGGEDISPEG